MIQCAYPKCKKEATARLGMNDPDAEMIPYCDEHIEVVKINTFLNFKRRKQ